MRQWEVYSYEFAAPIGEHPVVVISNKKLCENGLGVNVLKCVTQRGGREANEAEVILNGADGFDHKTLCACDKFYLVKKEELKGPKGTVSRARRQAIVKTIVRLLEP